MMFVAVIKGSTQSKRFILLHTYFQKSKIHAIPDHLTYNCTKTKETNRKQKVKKTRQKAENAARSC